MPIVDLTTSCWLMVLVMGLLVLPACVGMQPPNASFPLSVQQARAELKQMRDDRKPLTRPVVVLGGHLDPGLSSGPIRRRLQRAFDDDRILVVTFATAMTFDECRRRVIAAVDEAFPSEDEVWTTQVDVIGVSMGGLVARYAAMPLEPDTTFASPGRMQPFADDTTRSRQLHIARLFTISSPHTGARLAALPGLTYMHVDMRPGSPFLHALAAHIPEAPYELLPYVRLGDGIVGSHHAAPDGVTPIWIPNRIFQPAHVMAHMDPRIQADIARRLRGEPSYCDGQRLPLPVRRASRPSQP